MDTPKRKFIAWLNGCSVAIGPTAEDVEATARQLAASDRWRETNPKGTILRVTTYGSQRLVKEEAL
jgi:hypothetical protein